MRLFEDLKSARSIYIKGMMFVVISLLAGGLLLFRAPRFDVALLLLTCVWAACRAYYFAFYVIQHYVDEEYRYTGVIDFVRYVISKKE